MPPLIYVAPNQAHYGMTPQEYGKLIAALRSEPTADNLEVDGFAGSVTYAGVDFCWSYAPEPGGGLTTAALTVTIVAKHGIKARLAPNETIFELLDNELIAKLSAA